MTAIMLILLLVAAVAAFVGVAALFVARGLRRQLMALREDLAAHHAESLTGHAAVPGARTAPHAEEIRGEEMRTEEIRSAVAAALADERERELAEARAFWAAQDAREAADASVFDGQHAYEGHLFEGQTDLQGFEGYGTDEPSEFEVLPFLPRQADLVGLEPVRRHPSDPEFTPSSPIITDPEGTVARLAELAELRIPLADVRPGPLGTLDLYVFADGTTLCLTPGNSETADKLAAAIDRGDTPFLLGGSTISGGYALTFSCGEESREESVFILADRVVASL